MTLLGGLATRTGFSAAEIETMKPVQLIFWARCVNLYDEEIKANED